MAVTGLEKTTTKLDQVKQFGGLVLVAIVVAVLATSILIFTGIVNFVSTPQLRLFGFLVPSNVTIFVGVFTVSLAVILGYVYFLKWIRRYTEKAIEFWFGLSTSAQAVILGVQAGIISALWLFLTSRYGIYEFEIYAVLGAGVLTAVLITYVTIQLAKRDWTVTGWVRIVYTGVFIGAMVGTLSQITFDGVVPGYIPPLMFFLFWALCLYVLYRRQEGVEDSQVNRVLTKTGYAQMRQVETLTVSVMSGLILGVVLAAIVGYAGTFPNSTAQRVVITLLIVWPVVTLATSVGWPSSNRTDIVIDDIRVRSSTGRREVTFRNIGNRQITLYNAKLTDATNDLYHIGINATLGAGESGKFELPDSFEFATHEPYDVASLPFKLSVTKEATEPTIVTRDGRKYILRWADQV